MGLVKLCFLATTGHQPTKLSSFPYDPAIDASSSQIADFADHISYTCSVINGDFTPVCRGDEDTVFTIGGEYAVKTGEINSWFRNQGNQPRDKIQRFENHMGRAIAPGCFRLIVHLTIAGC
jgi:hypothetical protein